MKKQAESNSQNHDNVKIFNEQLYIRKNFHDDNGNNNRVWKICVPREKRIDIIHESHEGKLACHGGRFKTTARVKETYFWPGMSDTIAKYVRNCELCKKTKAYNRQTTPPAGEFVEAKTPWRIVATDICGPFPRSSNNNKYLLVAIDVFSKYTEMKAVREANASAIIKFLKQNVIFRHGCPEIVISDNGTQYKSKMFEDFTNSFGIKRWYTANYFAQANITECVNKTIGNAIRTYISDELNHSKWDANLNEIQCSLNTATHTSTSKSPHEINYGYPMIDHGKLHREIGDANESFTLNRPKFMKLHEKIQKILNENREKHVKRYNLRTREIEYKIGDIVYRKNNVLSNADKKLCKKLMPKFIKCEIEEKTGTNTYRLKELDTGKSAIHHAKNFHK